jgi:hypothetical protein
VSSVPQRHALTGIALSDGLAIGLNSTQNAVWIAAPTTALAVNGRFAQLALSPLSSATTAYVCGVTLPAHTLLCFGSFISALPVLNATAPFRSVAFGACAGGMDRRCVCAVSSADVFACTAQCPAAIRRLQGPGVRSAHIGFGAAACVLLNNGTAVCRVLANCLAPDSLPPLQLPPPSVQFTQLSSGGDLVCGLTDSLPASAVSSAADAGLPGLLCFTRGGNWSVAGDFASLSVDEMVGITAFVRVELISRV